MSAPDLEHLAARLNKMAEQVEVAAIATNAGRQSSYQTIAASLRDVARLRTVGQMRRAVLNLAELVDHECDHPENVVSINEARARRGAS